MNRLTEGSGATLAIVGTVLIVGAGVVLGTTTATWAQQDPANDSETTVYTNADLASLPTPTNAEWSEEGEEAAAAEGEGKAAGEGAGTDKAEGSSDGGQDAKAESQPPAEQPDPIALEIAKAQAARALEQSLRWLDQQKQQADLRARIAAAERRVRDATTQLDRLETATPENLLFGGVSDQGTPRNEARRRAARELSDARAELASLLSQANRMASSQ